jgi:hypothetical protein
MPTARKNPVNYKNAFPFSETPVVSGGNAFLLSYFSVTVQMPGGCCRNAGIYLLRRTL